MPWVTWYAVRDTRCTGREQDKTVLTHGIAGVIDFIFCLSIQCKPNHEKGLVCRDVNLTIRVRHSVNDMMYDYMQKHDTLDVLINNAANFDLSVKKPIITADGMERQFATNVAAPFLLSKLLFPALKNSDDGRMINISSQGLCVYPFIKLDFGNLNGERSYSLSKTYYQNKLALLMWSLYMANEHKDIKIQAVRVTNVKIDMSRYDNIHPFLKQMYKVKSKFSISPEEMAKVYTAIATAGDYSGFLYNEKMKEVRANKSAYDVSAQKKLYELLCNKTDAFIKEGM